MRERGEREGGREGREREVWRCSIRVHNQSKETESCPNNVDRETSQALGEAAVGERRSWRRRGELWRRTISLHRCHTHRLPCRLRACSSALRSRCGGEKEEKGKRGAGHLPMAWIQSSFSLSDSAHIKMLSSLEAISNENCLRDFESAAWGGQV
jgi:hypothetical protein